MAAVSHCSNELGASLPVLSIDCSGGAGVSDIQSASLCGTSRPTHMCRPFQGSGSGLCSLPEGQKFGATGIRCDACSDGVVNDGGTCASVVTNCGQSEYPLKGSCVPLRTSCPLGSELVTRMNPYQDHLCVLDCTIGVCPAGQYLDVSRFWADGMCSCVECDTSVCSSVATGCSGTSTTPDFTCSSCVAHFYFAAGSCVACNVSPDAPCAYGYSPNVCATGASADSSSCYANSILPELSDPSVCHACGGPCSAEDFENTRREQGANAITDIAGFCSAPRCVATSWLPIHMSPTDCGLNESPYVWVECCADASGPATPVPSLEDLLVCSNCGLRCSSLAGCLDAPESAQFTDNIGAHIPGTVVDVLAVGMVLVSDDGPIFGVLVAHTSNGVSATSMAVYTTSGEALVYDRMVVWANGVLCTEGTIGDLRVSAVCGGALTIGRYDGLSTTFMFESSPYAGSYSQISAMGDGLAAVDGATLHYWAVATTFYASTPMAVTATAPISLMRIHGSGIMYAVTTSGDLHRYSLQSTTPNATPMLVLDGTITLGHSVNLLLGTPSRMLVADLGAGEPTRITVSTPTNELVFLYDGDANSFMALSNVLRDPPMEIVTDGNTLKVENLQFSMLSASNCPT